MSGISVEIADKIATISLNRPDSLNALTADDYIRFADALREIDKRDDVLCTIWQASGKWFCAGTDITAYPKGSLTKRTGTEIFMSTIAGSLTNMSQALYSHSKLLVAALNGPVLGVAAGYLGHFDFIYCMPNAWLAAPFVFLGLASEGGSSVTFVNRMGIAKANEALLFGRKMSAADLERCGFVNKIFPQQSVPEFHASVRQSVLDDLEGLDPAALLMMKGLIQTGLNEQNSREAVNARESFAGMESRLTGFSEKRFGQLVRKEVRHKL